jgi:hypothetical protein
MAIEEHRAGIPSPETVGLTPQALALAHGHVVECSECAACGERAQLTANWIPRPGPDRDGEVGMMAVYRICGRCWHRMHRDPAYLSAVEAGLLAERRLQAEGLDPCPPTDG